MWNKSGKLGKMRNQGKDFPPRITLRKKKEMKSRPGYRSILPQQSYYIKKFLAPSAATPPAPILSFFRFPLSLLK